MVGPAVARKGRAWSCNSRLKDGGLGMAWALGADGGVCQSWLAGPGSGENLCYLLCGLPCVTHLLGALGIHRPTE